MSEEFKAVEEERSYLVSYARPHTGRIWEARGDSGLLGDVVTVRIAELVDGRWFAERWALRGVCEWAVVYAEDRAGAEQAAQHFMAEIRVATRRQFERWPKRREVKPRW